MSIDSAKARHRADDQVGRPAGQITAQRVRWERQAAELRANLKRRKDKARHDGSVGDGGTVTAVRHAPGHDREET